MNIKQYIIACLSLLVLVSCSEKDDAIVEYADWKNKNEKFSRLPSLLMNMTRHC